MDRLTEIYEVAVGLVYLVMDKNVAVDKVGDDQSGHIEGVIVFLVMLVVTKKIF